MDECFDGTTESPIEDYWFMRLIFQVIVTISTCQNEKWKLIPAGIEWQNIFPSQRVLPIRRAYPQSFPAGHGGVTALAAGKVDQVDLAGDAVLVLLSLHQLRLAKIKGANKKKRKKKKQTPKLHVCCISICVLVKQMLIKKCCIKKEEEKSNTNLRLGHD